MSRSAPASSRPSPRQYDDDSFPPPSKPKSKPSSKSDPFTTTSLNSTSRNSTGRGMLSSASPGNPQVQSKSTKNDPFSPSLTSAPSRPAPPSSSSKSGRSLGTDRPQGSNNSNPIGRSSCPTLPPIKATSTIAANSRSKQFQHLPSTSQPLTPSSPASDSDFDHRRPHTPFSAPDLHDYGNESDMDGGIQDTSKSNFKLLQSIDVKTAIDNGALGGGGSEHDAPALRIDMWRSKATGITIVKADAPGPLLRASIHVQLPNYDNRGIPSALLDMIDATGTTNDPQKDFLTVLGSRLMTSGLHIASSLTCATFKLESASADGFLDMLAPVFERIMHPNLTNEVFMTEVHHVDGNGRNGGRAFLRAQEVEFKMSRVMSEAIHDELFTSNGPMRYSPDGSAAEVAKLDLDAIATVHNNTFVPQALLLVVTGGASTSALLSTLQNHVEPILKDLVRAKHWQRPFVSFDDKGVPLTGKGASSYLPITRSKTKRAVFAGRDGGRGQVRLAWEGPPPGSFDKIVAMNVVTNYLLQDRRNADGQSLNPLFATILTGADASCATDLAFEWSRTNPTIRIAILNGVDDKDLDGIGQRFQDCLDAMLNDKDAFSSDVMNDLLDKAAQDQSAHMEEDPTSWLTAASIFDWTFGENDGKSFPKSTLDVVYLEQLKKWTPKQWIEVTRKYMNKDACLTFIGRPSEDVAKSAKAARKALEKLNRGLNPHALVALDKALDEATSAASGQVPAEELKAFPLVSTDSMKCFEVATARSQGVAQANQQAESKKLQDEIDDEKVKLPYFVQFDGFESSFIAISIVLAPEPLPRLVGPFAAFFVKGLFNLPVKRADKTLLDVRQLKKELQTLALSWGASVVRERIVVDMKILKENYTDAIALFRDVLEGSIFESKPLAHAVAKVASDVSRTLKDGKAVAYQGFRKLIMGSDSIEAVTSWKAMKKSVHVMRELTEKEPDIVEDNMEELRHRLLDNRSLRIHVAGDILDLKNPAGDWDKHFVQYTSISSKDLIEPALSCERLTELGHLPAKKVALWTFADLFESCACFGTKVDIDNKSDELPALFLALSALHAEAGPFDRALRDSDIVGEVRLWFDHETGYIQISFVDCPSPDVALAVAKKVVSDHISRTTPVDDVFVAEARGAWALWVAQKESTAFETAKVSFNDQVIFGRDQFFESLLLHESEKNEPSSSSIIAAMRKYILPVFSPDTAVGCIATTVKNGVKVRSNLLKLGFDVSVEEIPEEVVETGCDSRPGATGKPEDDAISQPAHKKKKGLRDEKGLGGLGRFKIHKTHRHHKKKDKKQNKDAEEAIKPSLSKDSVGHHHKKHHKKHDR